MMPSGLSPNQCNEIEHSGVIPEECTFLNPTLHFCPDWNDMLIDSGDVEFEKCKCLWKESA